MYVRARTRVYYVQSIYSVGGRLIIEANIPVQELEGKRGEGAYFRRGLILGGYGIKISLVLIKLTRHYLETGATLDLVLTLG